MEVLSLMTIQIQMKKGIYRKKSILKSSLQIWSPSKMTMKILNSDQNYASLSIQKLFLYSLHSWLSIKQTFHW